MSKEIEEHEKEAIENFLLDIDSLDQITAKLSHFNVFETLGLINMELKHSNVLGWLMNPNENHGLDDIFLKKFVQGISKNNKDFLKSYNIDLIYLSLIDYSNVIVRREWNNIDLLIELLNEKLVIVIENKIWSKEHSMQLQRYRTIIESEYKEHKKIYIFLTPAGEIPSDEEYWIPVTYQVVQESLNESIELNGGNISNSVKIFLEQYLEILRRYIVGNSDLEKICRDIYYKHQKALDLIFDYKPDIYYDISMNIKDIINKNDNIIIDNAGKTYLNFTTQSYEKLIPKEGYKWTASKRILMFEIANKNDKLSFRLIIGPGNQEIRTKLFEIASKHSEIFKGASKNLTDNWTTIFSKDIMKKGYIDRMDNDLDMINKEVETKLIKLLTNEVLEQEKIIVEEYKTI